MFTQEQFTGLLWNLLQVVLIGAIPVIVKVTSDELKRRAALVAQELAQGGHSDFLYNLRNVANLFVRAAEQIYGSGQGQAKKAYVINAVQAYFSEKNIPLSASLIEGVTESAVLDNFAHDPARELVGPGSATQASSGSNGTQAVTDAIHMVEITH